MPILRRSRPGEISSLPQHTENQYRCNLCEASGNSVSLYARMNGTSYRQAHEVLSKDGGIYRFPQQPLSQKPPEPEPKPLAMRHDVYYDMLSHLTLSPKHHNDLLSRGLSEERISQICTAASQAARPPGDCWPACCLIFMTWKESRASMWIRTAFGTSPDTAASWCPTAQWMGISRAFRSVWTMRKPGAEVPLARQPGPPPRSPMPRVDSCYRES